MTKVWSSLFGSNHGSKEESRGSIRGSTYSKNHQGLGYNRRYHVQFYLVGATGAGKTATIQHLFGQNDDLSGIGLKTSKRSSETRETVEYLLNFKQKKSKKSSHFMESITLGIVDTPGLDDTEGVEQDARNIASIRKFGDACKDIRPELPNLVFFILKADGTRDFGPESVLSRCIRLYLGPLMNLTEDGSNVVIVLTHALNISQSDKAWAGEATRRMKDVQDFVEERTGWRVPVVLLENKLDPFPERMKKTGEFTRFPDKKTWQPRNLFDAIGDVLDNNNDALAKSVVDTFFARSSKDSQVDIYRGLSVKASLVHQRVDLTKLESDFLDLMNQARQPPQHSTVEAHEPDDAAPTQPASNKEEADEKANEESEEPIDDDISGGDDSYSTISSSTMDDKDKYHGSLLGKGYNLCNKDGEGEIREDHVFKKSFIDENIVCKSCSKTLDTTLDKCNKNGIFFDGKISGKYQSPINAAASVGIGANTSTTDLKIDGSRVIKVLSQKVQFKQEFYEKGLPRSCLCDSFIVDLEKIPSRYTESNQKQFVKFFSKHGQGFVKVGFYGGEAKFKILGNEEEQGSDRNGLLEGGVSTISLGTDGAKGGSRIVKDRRSQVTFHGGNRAYHKEELIEEWMGSVDSCPEELIHDVSKDIELYHNFVARLWWLKKYDKKSDALEQAFHDLYAPTRVEVVEAEETRNEALSKKWWQVWRG